MPHPERGCFRSRFHSDVALGDRVNMALHDRAVGTEHCVLTHLSVPCLFISAGDLKS